MCDVLLSHLSLLQPDNVLLYFRKKTNIQKNNKIYIAERPNQRLPRFPLWISTLGWDAALLVTVLSNQPSQNLSLLGIALERTDCRLLSLRFQTGD